jgi:cullin 3
MQISETELKSHLIPLCQFKILQKNPQGKEFKMEDQLKVNLQYHNNLIKVKVPVMHSKIQKQTEAADVQEKVEDDRKYMIEATIVKIMKSRRRISHTDLIAEATKILSTKFNPDPTVIKKRIEGLIEREYMKRCEEDRKFYQYCA